MDPRLAVCHPPELPRNAPSSSIATVPELASSRDLRRLEISLLAFPALRLLVSSPLLYFTSALLPSTLPLPFLSQTLVGSKMQSSLFLRARVRPFGKCASPAASVPRTRSMGSCATFKVPRIDNEPNVRTVTTVLSL